MKAEKIYIGTLYRFGYDLTAAGTNVQEVIDAIMGEYTNHYSKINYIDPSEEESDRWYAEDGESAYDVARDDIEIMELKPYEVRWC